MSKPCKKNHQFPLMGNLIREQDFIEQPQFNLKGVICSNTLKSKGLQFTVKFLGTVTHIDRNVSSVSKPTLGIHSHYPFVKVTKTSSYQVSGCW